MVLKIGDKGSLVEALQTGLYRAGYLSGNPDGYFGDKTKAAVMNFQKANMLTEDGIAGKNTIAVIEKYLKGFYKRKITKGDTFWKIAADTGISPIQLVSANPELSPENLIPGQEITIPYPFRIVPTDISYSYYLTNLLIEGLKARYPFLNVSTIGHSTMGKPIHNINLGNGKNEIFINSGFHANEWLNIPVVLKYLEEFLYAAINKIPLGNIFPDEIIRQLKINITPLVNPDGIDLVTGAITDGIYYDRAQKIAADFPDVPFPEGWKANINGVDLNLQFPANWEKAKEIKFAQGFNRPSPIEFVGNSPLSEPEAVSVFNFTKNNGFNLMLAYHSQGNIIYWKYLDFLPPDSERIGNNLSTVSGYPLELTPPDSSFAGYKDWFIQEYNRPGYTIETGYGKNPLPISQFDSIYSANSKLISQAFSDTITINDYD